MRKTALFVGKFMPFHKGHEHVIRKLLGKYNVVVAIGSMHEKQFPFKERKKMVERCFGSRVKIISVADTKSDSEWARKIRKKARFDFVVTGNPWVARCFRDVEVRKPDFLNPKIYHGRVIRKRMKEGREWKKLVPRKVYNIITEK